MTTLFISDLHLDAVRPDTTALFLEFLETEARRAEKLYILGDFFEVWIGDDDPDPHHAEVMRSLRRLTDAGVPVSFMRGNRDFIIGTDFAASTGVELLEDPTVVDLYGQPTLLMHGDTLCTDDVEYQAMRRMFHDPRWQQAMLAKPLEERRAFARSARAESKSRTAAKAEYIMDVNQGAVAAAMREHGVRRLIHGHTHRPAIHRFQSDAGTMERVVLGDWYEQRSCLHWQPSGGHLEDPRVKHEDAVAD